MKVHILIRKDAYFPCFEKNFPVLVVYTMYTINKYVRTCNLSIVWDYVVLGWFNLQRSDRRRSQFGVSAQIFGCTTSVFQIRACCFVRRRAILQSLPSHAKRQSTELHNWRVQCHKRLSDIFYLCVKVQIERYKLIYNMTAIEVSSQYDQLRNLKSEAAYSFALRSATSKSVFSKSRKCHLVTFCIAPFNWAYQDVLRCTMLHAWITKLPIDWTWLLTKDVIPWIYWFFPHFVNRWTLNLSHIIRAYFGSFIVHNA
jgi:hypothetical protein